MNELTIASVYHSSVSKKFLELNRELTETLNRRRDWTWLVADNTPADFKDHLDPVRFEIIKAVPFAEYTQTLESWQQPIRVSMHHANAVNVSLPHIKTRFALILDGDFYIVLPEWIDSILSYMKDHHVALLGAPWHPRWWKKSRYFPAHHALFVDTSQIPLSELDFQPQYQKPFQPILTEAGSADENEYNFTAASIWTPFINALRGRMYIGTSKDTSYAIYKKYNNSSFRVETITPVFKPKKGRPLHQILELFVPDRLSYIPRRSSYTTVGFKERGFFDAYAEGWEEFVWNDQPFGLHVRATPGGIQRNREEELEILSKHLNTFKV